MNLPKNPADRETPRHSLAVGVAVAAGVVAVVLRLIPHPPNFSSVGALGLFGGGRLRTWQAYLLPIGIMIVSDLGLWLLSGFDFNYSLGHPSRLFVYGSFLLYVSIGRWLIRRDSIGSIALAGTLGGMQFFLLTNFGEWLFQPLYYELIDAPFRYSRDLAGLATCFAAALPFYQGETAFSAHPFAVLGDFKLSLFWIITGDILFTTAYVAIHAKLAQQAAPTEQLPVPAANN